MKKTKFVSIVVVMLFFLSSVSPVFAEGYADWGTPAKRTKSTGGYADWESSNTKSTKKKSAKKSTGGYADW